MNLCLSTADFVVRKAWSPIVTQVRFRYHKDKVAAGPLVKRRGYEEKILNRGVLPHVRSDKQLPAKQYIPANRWSEEEAFLGQNDYIDIFTGKLQPYNVLYDVPAWLRGFRGREYQVLIRQRKFMKDGSIPIETPTKWRDMNKRIRYLHKIINLKTPNYYFPGERLDI